MALMVPLTDAVAACIIATELQRLSTQRSRGGEQRDGAQARAGRIQERRCVCRHVIAIDVTQSGVLFICVIYTHMYDYVYVK
jgi:hypothetical protein